jgi:predicted alpha-1,2-mannosidase
MKNRKIYGLLIMMLGYGFLQVSKAQDVKDHGGLPSANYVPHLTDHVDPYIGSGGHGHTFVGASVPFGMVQLGPQNIFKGWDWDSGYNYGDSILIGFSHTHLSGTGIGDLGDILIMPYNGPVKTDKGTQSDPKSGYAAHYSHQTEKVRPGYYSVLLDDYGIRAELTATERVGFHQYHFPQGRAGHIIIDLNEGNQDQSYDTFIEQVDEYTFKGYRFSKGWAKDQRIYFAVKSDVPVRDFKVYDDQSLQSGNKAQGKSIKGLISFENTPGLVKLKVGLSPVSSDNALANIAAEIPQWDFNGIVAKADQKWNAELSKIAVETASATDKRIFYTALYHTMIHPSIFNDANGDYRGADKKVYKNATFTNYSIFSTWDTYRAAHPLYDLIQPKRAGDMVNTMLAIADEQGRLPIWYLMGYDTRTMVGISSMQIIAEAYLKGIKGFDPQRAFNAIKKTAMGDSLGLSYVKTFRAIPADKESRSVAKGLEYAIGDGSTALMAKKLNRTEDYQHFLKRARNYQLYFDPKYAFFNGKLSDGSWKPNFDPLKAKNTIYAEGNGWQYLWLVPQDVNGLVKLLGGEKAFNNRLDSLFTIKSPEGADLIDLTGAIGQYAHGNEPSHHISYLYAYSGQQWKTAEKVRHILKDMYLDKPDGIIGNEDCGQMSAWAVFSAMGIYPVFPASGLYVFGSPSVNKATIDIPGGKKFTILAVNNSAKNIYIQRAELNGKPYPYSYLKHTDILKGGVLKFVMGAKPNVQFGRLAAYRPSGLAQ